MSEQPLEEGLAYAKQSVHNRKTGWVFPRVVVGGGICLWSYFSILPKTATINRYSQKQKDYNVLSLSLPTRDE